MKQLKFGKHKLFGDKISKEKLISLVPFVAVSFTACFCMVVSLLALSGKNSSGQGGFESLNPVLTDENIKESHGDILQSETSQNTYEDLYYYSYRIKKGDMIGVIAENEGITQDTLISVNHIRSSRLLQIGQYIKIPSMPGILYTTRTAGETPETIAEKYNIDENKIAHVNKIALGESLAEGTSLFLPDAQLDWVTRQEINGDLFIKPIHTRWYLTSHFGWRSSPFTGKRTYHSGTDMACGTGTNVYSALDGIVKETGYSTVYGNYVIVGHHSGYKTLYGHLSKITTSKGKSVTTSTKIGEVGNTGMSTGPHLHFTVFKNGKAVNGESLWK